MSYQYTCGCIVVKERNVPGLPLEELERKEFSDTQEGYMWIRNDVGFELPQGNRVSEVNGYECMSFVFMTNVLDINTRREGFDFGVIPVVSDEYSYVVYYKRLS